MDPTTSAPELSPQGEPINMDELAETVRWILVPEQDQAPGGELQQLLRLRDNLPQGMTQTQRAEADALFDRAFSVFDTALSFVHLTQRHELFRGSAEPDSAPTIEELRQHVGDFARDELVDDTDAHQIVAAMARLFQGPLASVPDRCVHALEVMFIFQIGIPTSSALSRLFFAYLYRNTRSIREISQSLLDSGTRFEFIRLGGILIRVNERPPYPLANDDSDIDIDSFSDHDGDRNSDSNSNSGSEQEYGTLHWLTLSTIVLADPPSQEFDLDEQESQGRLSSSYRDIIDLSHFMHALRDYNSQLYGMFTGTVAHDDFYPHHHQPLRDNIYDFDRVWFPDLPDLEDDVALGGEVDERIFADDETILSRIHERLFEAERRMIAREESLLRNGHTLEAYGSRYERTRYRYRLKSRVAGFRNERYRDMFRIPSSVQPAPIARPYETADPCAICYDALERTEGEVSCPPVVTYHCCNRPFHTDCLLGWLLPNAHGLMTCPWCRASVSLENLGEVLESRVRELQCL
jgi:hypothetical protein